MLPAGPVVIAQPIDGAADAGAICDLAQRWMIAPELAYKLHSLAAFLPFGISIFSGHRSIDEQNALLANPDTTAAPADLSTHTSCPATGADLRVHVEETVSVKRQLGRAAEMAGLRWGGGAQRKDDIPVGVEWRHVDLGRRS